MNFFNGDKLSGKETQWDRRCPHCDAQPRLVPEQPRLVREMMDSRTGRIIRMFECKCGERTWDE
jgi:hypothetical protein